MTCTLDRSGLRQRGVGSAVAGMICDIATLRVGTGVGVAATGRSLAKVALWTGAMRTLGDGFCGAGETSGTSGVLFSIVNEIYEYYEAPSAISLFRINEFFSHHFWGLKLEIFDPRNVRKLIRIPYLSNEYVNYFRYDPVLCPNKLIYRRQITA